MRRMSIVGAIVAIIAIVGIIVATRRGSPPPEDAKKTVVDDTAAKLKAELAEKERIAKAKEEALAKARRQGEDLLRQADAAIAAKDYAKARAAVKSLEGLDVPDFADEAKKKLAEIASCEKRDREWPGWRGHNRDGKSLETGLLKEWPAEGPKLLWQVDDIGVGFSSVAVTGGTVYISGDKAGKLMVFALDLDGKQVWKAEHGGNCGGPDGSRSTPVIDGGLLYIINGAGLIGCYDAKTGEKKWTSEMKDFGGGRPGWSYSESVLIYKDLAIVTPGGKNCIVALDKATGEKVWASEGFTAGAQYGSCIAFTFEGVPLIVNGTGGGLVGVDARDGRVLWSDNWSAGNTANCTTPVYADGHVFWSNGYGKGGVCLKLTAEEGKVTAERAWTTSDLQSHHGGYLIKDGLIYGNTEGGVACLDLKTGEKKWFDRAAGKDLATGKDWAVGKGSLCYADGMLYLFSENGGRAALATCSPEGLEIKGKVQVKGKGPSWAHPVVAGGRLYLRYDTNLYCFDVKGN